MPIRPMAVIGNDVLAKLQRHFGVWWFNNNWLPSGMIFTSADGTGTFGWDSSYVYVHSGDTSLSTALLGKLAEGLSFGGSWAKKRYFGTVVYLGAYSAQYIHIVTGKMTPNASANTYHHIGFKLIDDSLYGTVADGTTETTLLLETLTAAAYRILECIFIPGVECRFYVDGVDKGAITTNLPTGTQYANYMLYASTYNTEALDKPFKIYELRTFQEE